MSQTVTESSSLLDTLFIWLSKQKRILGHSKFRHAVARLLPVAFPFGPLRQLRPVSRDFGYRRGSPVDRYYIEQFLEKNRSVIRGRVMEIGDRDYTLRFAGALDISDVLHVDPANPNATIIGDLATADHIPSNSFDCIICTQTLHLIYDFHAAIGTLHRILKPGGILLATFPGVSQISTDEWNTTWYWSFTTRSAKRMFEPVFDGPVEIGADGNVLAAAAYLYGLSQVELSHDELNHVDPQYELIVRVKATKGKPS